MRPLKTPFSIFSGTFLCLLLAASFAPAEALAITPSAIKGKDEKNFTAAPTRCLTKAMKNLNASMVKRMKADIDAAEKRLGKKFGPVVEVPKPQPVEKRVCSSGDMSAMRICVVGQLAAGKGYRVEFYDFSGKASDMLVISPVQGGVSSPSLSVQVAMTGSSTSGTSSFEGLSAGSYTAYGFTNPNGTAREPDPRMSVTFIVDAQPTMTTPTVAVLMPAKKNPAETYKEKMEMVWAAMAEPYCGYGSRGITAVKKSYNKSVEHARAAFLKETKK